MTISYFCHDTKRRGGGGPRVNVIMTLKIVWEVSPNNSQNGSPLPRISTTFPSKSSGSMDTDSYPCKVGLKRAVFPRPFYVIM